ncbi:MAG: ammonium transporter [Pseudomonadota bacterium]
MKTRLALLAVLALLPALAFAADAKPTLNSGDTAWMLTSTALVLFMTLPGLALFYAGLVRSKNVLSVLMQCFAITAMISIVWALVGYSIAFGDGGAQNAWWGGLGKAFLDGVGAGTIKDTIPESVFVMFQMTFAIITPALVVGGFAERMKFSAMMWFSLLWVLLVYLPVCHWVWAPGGWLQKMNLMDFAGGTVVHINAGVAALVAALVLGRRKGFPQTAMPPHNLTMTVAGASMLWVGWFGFNAGSAVAANTSAGMAMLVTHLGAAAGAFAWMACEWVWFKKPSVLGIVTGMVAGLGTITPASGYVGPLGALVIGLMAGVVCFGATNFLKRVLHIDDSLDVFPVHGVGGILGTFAVAIFAGTLGGLGYAEGMTMGKQIGVQLLGIGVTIVWSGVLTYVLLKIIDWVIGLRVSSEEENEGLDTVLHNETGYNL